MLQHVVGVAPTEQGVKVDPILVAIGATNRLEVLLLRSPGAKDTEIQRQTDLDVGTDTAGQANSESVGQQEVVRRRDRFANALTAWSVMTVAVTEPRAAPRFVECRPLIDPVESLEEDPGVIGEAKSGVTVYPTTLILQGLGQVPVVHGGQRGDSTVVQARDESLVEIQTLLVDGSRHVGQDAGPRNRESVRSHTEVREEIEVFLGTVVVIARDVAGVAVHDPTTLVTEGVPDGRRASVLVDGALDLVGGGRRTPDEAVRELQVV